MNPLAKLFLLLTLPLAAMACHQRRAAANSGAQQTQTIAPAQAKPSPQSDTSELTQTVDIEDSRSEAEGGALNTPPPPAKKPVAAPSKKKH